MWFFFTSISNFYIKTIYVKMFYIIYCDCDISHCCWTKTHFTAHWTHFVHALQEPTNTMSYSTNIDVLNSWEINSRITDGESWDVEQLMKTVWCYSEELRHRVLLLSVNHAGVWYLTSQISRWPRPVCFTALRQGHVKESLRALR